MKKRDFLKLTSFAAAGTIIAPALTFCTSQNTGDEGEKKADTDDTFATFTLASLPYAYDALEPYIDARTMELHHSKHHQAYTNNLNKALEGHTYAGKSVEDILAAVQGTDDELIRNNGGGYFNHNLFWEIMAPSAGGEPQGALATAIAGSFGSFDAFKKEFARTAGSVFGSGWAWLCANKNELYLTSTPNQDNPLMRHIAEKPGTPLLGLDVWEHAYYLQYQNRRSEYIDGFFSVINWDNVAARLGAVSG
jgi:Fe-Mn family superoxide dismutase